MFRNKSVNQHQFSLVPRSDVPRSMFKRSTNYKTTINSGYLYPFFIDEVLPSDSFNFRATVFGRMLTPLVPFMDNLHADTFYFFVPNRLVWDNWVKMQGERDNPDDSIDYTVPQMVSPVGGYALESLQDYFGLPIVGQVDAGSTITHSALPFRAYNLIYNEWFRDENLQDSIIVDKDDGPDTYSDYVLRRRGKRKDYFTSCLPFAQKGAAVTLPLGDRAPIVTDTPYLSDVSVLSTSQSGTFKLTSSTADLSMSNNVGSDANLLFADLSQATASTVNALRLSFQIQKLLERDARGGTRYVEMLQAHFGVTPQDYRLQRPEYLGGSSVPITINPIAQTAATGTTGSSTPLGQLAAMGTIIDTRNNFRYAAQEHGYIIGLIAIRADLGYQNGMRKLWSRETRYDFYMPEFAMLGEQPVLNKEIFCDGTSNDDGIFGYQERWAEYRYFPSQVTAKMRSYASGTLDIWHLTQNFAALPTLNDTFIQDDPPVGRVVAVNDEPQFQLDIGMQIDTVRPLPVYSVPGLIDHF